MHYFAAADSCDAISVLEAVDVVDATYRAMGEGLVEMSDPSMMRVGNTAHRLGAKGAVLNHLGIAGIRLVSRAAPRLMLWSLDTGEPLAFFDEKMMYRFRTGVSAAVVARYLLPKSRPLKRVTIIGAGPIAKQVAIAITETLSPEEILIVSRNQKSSALFARTCRSENLPVAAAATVADATENADLIVTITSANEILVRPEHVKKGAVVLSMGGGQELHPQVWASASMRYVDDLNYALQQGDAHAWISQGEFSPATFDATLTGTIGALAAGHPALTTSNEDVSIAIVQGTTALDIALAFAVYEVRKAVVSHVI